jgi:hypothetical protein
MCNANQQQCYSFIAVGALYLNADMHLKCYDLVKNIG